MIELVAEPWLECTRRGAPQGGLGKIRNRNRYDTTVGAAGDEWYYIFGSSSNVTVTEEILIFTVWFQ